MIFCTEELANEFKRKFDQYSDSYTKKVTTDHLKSILYSMDEKVSKWQSNLTKNILKLQFVSFKDLEDLSRHDIYQLEKELAGDQAKPENMFRLATAYFYKTTQKCAKKMELAEQLFKLRGGKVKQSIDNQLSHVFIDIDGFDTDSFLNDCNLETKEFIKDIRIVSYDWILQCYNTGKKFNVKPFQVEI